MSSTCFKHEGSSSGRLLCVQVWYMCSTCISISSVVGWRLVFDIACTDTCKTYHTITAYITVFLKTNPPLRKV